MKNYELVEKLIEKGYRICCAESCTGGMLSSLIVDVPSASAVMDMGFVTYANSAKSQLLGVDQEVIDKYGVVSEPVAMQMAKGAAERAGAQVGVGISGIAGPTGATENKPIGMVCFGFYINGRVFAKTSRFGEQGRQKVRELACDTAINTLLSEI